MKKLISVFIILLIHQYLCLFSQIKEPLNPSIPDIDEQYKLKPFQSKTRITIHGKTDVLECVIELNSDAMKTGDKGIINIKDVSKIDILMWGRKTSFNKHVFYPVRYEILFRDNRKVFVDGNIDLLNRIKIGNKKFIYSYYYDYYKKGKWSNGGSADFKATHLRPAAGCAVVIEFL